MTEPSVTSRVSRWAGTPCRRSSRATSSTRSASCRLRAERLTAIAEVVPGRPPAARTAASDGVEDVGGQRADQTAALGDRDELVGRDPAELGVLPAHERLDADHLARRELRLGLHVHLDRRRSAARSRSSETSVSRRGLLGVAARGSYSRSPRVEVFASYIARSARLSRVAGSVACAGARAMPTRGADLDLEAVEGDRAARGRAACRRPICSDPAPRRRCRARRTANSSPPSRATVPAVPTAAVSRAPTSTSSWSPCWWPRVSLTALNSSRSRIITAAPGERPAATSSSAAASARCRSARLGSPVSASCSASWRSWPTSSPFCRATLAWLATVSSSRTSSCVEGADVAEPVGDDEDADDAGAAAAAARRRRRAGPGRRASGGRRRRGCRAA